MSGWMEMITKSGGTTGGGDSSSSNGQQQYGDQTMQSLGSIAGNLSAHEQYKNNARYMKDQKKAVLRQAENAAANHKRHYGQLASSQKAGFGANGVDVNTGSPVEAMAATDGEGVVGAGQIKHAGEMEALHWRLREKNAKQKQRMALMNAAVSASDIWQKSGNQKFWDGYKGSGGGRTLGD